MKRRLSLARALVNDPRLLLLERTHTGLDPQARHLMWERCNCCCSRQVDPADHAFMDEAERLCSRLLVLTWQENCRGPAARSDRPASGARLVRLERRAEPGRGAFEGAGGTRGGEWRDRVLLYAGRQAAASST